jgi:hypothetical protein
VRELLIRTNLVDEEYLDKVLALTRRMPLGRVLELEGHCKETTVEAAFELQRLMQGGHISIENAISALELVGYHNIDLDTVLRRMGVITGGLKASEFAHLLIDSGLISSEQLECALRHGHITNLPVGSVLVCTGVISDTMLKAALLAESLVRSAALLYEDAVRLLDELRVRGGSLQELLSALGISAPPISLLERLLRTGIVSESEMLAIREMSVTSSHTTEQILLDCGFISPEQLAAFTDR